MSSETLQMLFGYLMYKLFKGRRFLLQAILLSAIFLFECMHVLLYTLTVLEVENVRLDFDSISVLYIITLQGICVYTLYYMMCICGPLDLAKVECLKSNLKITGMLYGVLCGFQCAIQGFFLDEFIDVFMNLDHYRNETSFFTIQGVTLTCTILAFLSIYRLVREELRELRSFGFGGVMDYGSGIFAPSGS